MNKGSVLVSSVCAIRSFCQKNITLTKFKQQFKTRRYSLWLVVGALLLAVLTSLQLTRAAVSLSTTTASVQNFDGIGTAATAALPADFKVDRLATVRTVGNYAAAATATTQVGGANLSSTAANGIYNFGSGTTTTGADRAIGFLSSGSGTQSGNLYAQLVNNTGGNLAGLTISYDVGKYRGGTNPAGFRLELFYSTDGAAWTSAGAGFVTAFVADAANTGFTPAPGATVSVTNKTLNATIPNGSNFYLAWNYSVSTGTTTSNAQALAIDNISILGIAGAGSTNPAGTGAASPSSVIAGNSTLLTVTVTPGANPASTGLSVSADLSPIGGSVTQTFYDDGTNGDAVAGNNVFSFQATVAGNTSGGAKNLAATITDAQSRTGNASIALTVLAPTSPAGVGAANPSAVQAGQATLLTVNVTPGMNPTSTGLTVTGNLSAIGGATTQAFFDDGTNGDATAGDKLFSYSATVAAGTSVGAKSLPITIADAQSRSGSASISLSVEGAPVLPGMVVLSQVYGGGGNSAATYRNDFVELFNRSSQTINVTGWSVQYASAAGTSWSRTNLTGSIPAGGYYLVQLAQGNGGTTNLPTPDALGTTNLSATQGKVALVSNTTNLSGSCPTGGQIIDFVGYGGASCFEGSGAAPELGNTLAAFRTRAGCKDVDDNSVDFTANPPEPRNSAAPGTACPVGDFAPETFSTVPGRDATSVPLQSNITIKFDEAVNVTGNWFNITCTASGQHTATVSGGPLAFTLNPDADFLPAEQCTVTVSAALVTDQDADDPPDAMTADYAWSFTVTYGAPVHLTLGNPSNAAPDVQQETNYLMEKTQYALSYHRFKGRANWVSWHLDSTWLGSAPRQDDFRPDPEVPAGWYQVLGTDYSGSGFDRGHMTPSADRTANIPDNSATFLMTNMMPQSPDNNQGPWAQLENYLRTLVAQGNELYIIAGAAGEGGVGSNGPATTIANGNVHVPANTWKVILVLPRGENDVARVSTATRTIAVIMPNVQGIRSDPWQKYLTTVDQVEALSGYNFFTNVSDSIQAVIEARLDPENNTPPVALEQSVNVAEDSSGAITLTATEANIHNTVTFRVVNGPTHGTLNGSGANLTYVPAADYFGPDSFTFKASDGTFESEAATVTITVTEVNDAPVAGPDTKSMDWNTTLSFPASDLKANDGAGAGESSQSLTVTTVAATANTHGTVTLTNGVVDYTPAANYSGPADFAYTVCDDGTTNGVADSKCTTGSVSVTVILVDVTPPMVTVPADTTREATSAAGAVVTFAVSANDQIDGAVAVTCDYSSGQTFPLGSTTVTCTATDAHNNTGSSSFTITVRDTTAPTLQLPTPITTEATGPNGVVVTYTTSATDLVDGVVTVNCTPAAGSTFGLGATTVNCSAGDSRGNTQSGGFMVTVVDTTRPTLVLPANITINATDVAGALVNFIATAQDTVAGALTVTCTPASGSTFGLGTTTVACAATDAHQNTTTGSFTVTVLGARARKEQVLATLTALQATVTNKQIDTKLDQAIDELRQALDPALWLNQMQLEAKQGDRVFKHEKAVLINLRDIQKDKANSIPAVTLQGLIDELAGIDRLLAQVAINVAASNGAEAKRLEKATDALAKGDSFITQGQYESGLEQYRSAWWTVQ